MKHIRLSHTDTTRRITLTLEARDFDDLLAAAKRRSLTLQELTERILVEALNSDLLAVILGEDDE